MANELAPIREILKGGEVGSTYLRIPPGTTEESWAKLATKVTTIGHGYWWWVGDLAAYAMHAFAVKTREEHIKALATATGGTVRYIEMCARTAKAYSIPRRIARLGISHHMALMRSGVTAAKQDALLQLAVRQNLTVSQLRQRILPKAKRTQLVLIRVPATIARKPSFHAALAQFAKQWHAVSFYAWGCKQPKKPRGTNPVKVLIG